nr:ABC transporter ATP-binding protein [Allgaiera sp.]
DFREKSTRVFRDRMRDAGAIFVSHSMGAMRDMCEAGAVLENGHLTYYDDIEEAIAHHEYNMASLKRA